MDGAIKKVMVIGLDGLSPDIVSRLLEAGQLPNLARLRERGGYGRVATTRPAQTPVAWSTFATGTNPGGHGIFDFLRRNPKNYLPDLALNRYEQKNAFLPPKAVNLRGGTPIWELLKSAGRGATVLRCPCTYPPDPIRGRMLSGMGVPDLRGGLGTATFYTADASAKPRESENVVRLEPGDGDGVYNAHLIGPRGPKGGDLRVEMNLRVDRQGRRVVLRSEGNPRELEVREGAWSDWLRVKFKVGLLQSIRGMVRFYLVACGPELALYASPINFDPDAPFFPISEPFEYAGDLAREIGLFYTTGMVEDHAGLNNEPHPPNPRSSTSARSPGTSRRAMMNAGLESFRRRPVLRPVSTPRPDPAPVLAIQRARPSGQPRPCPGPCIRPGDRRRLPALRRDRRRGPRARRRPDAGDRLQLSDSTEFNSFQPAASTWNTWLHRSAGSWRWKETASGPGEEAGDLLRQWSHQGRDAAPYAAGGAERDLPERPGPRGPGDRAARAEADAAQGRGGAGPGRAWPTPSIRARDGDPPRSLPREDGLTAGPTWPRAPDLVGSIFAEGVPHLVVVVDGGRRRGPVRGQRGRSGAATISSTPNW